MNISGIEFDAVTTTFNNFMWVPKGYNHRNMESVGSVARQGEVESVGVPPYWSAQAKCLFERAFYEYWALKALKILIKEYERKDRHGFLYVADYERCKGLHTDRWMAGADAPKIQDATRFSGVVQIEFKIGHGHDGRREVLRFKTSWNEYDGYWENITQSSPYK